MLDIFVSEHALKHGLSESDIAYAWSNFAKRRFRGQDFQVAIGYDSKGREIGMVAALLDNGDVLIIHAKAPAIASIKKELEE